MTIKRRPDEPIPKEYKQATFFRTINDLYTQVGKLKDYNDDMMAKFMSSTSKAVGELGDRISSLSTKLKTDRETLPPVKPENLTIRKWHRLVNLHFDHINKFRMIGVKYFEYHLSLDSSAPTNESWGDITQTNTAAAGNDSGDGDLVCTSAISTSIPQSGQVEIAGDTYSYTSYTGSTYDIVGTLSKSYTAGDAIRTTYSTIIARTRSHRITRWLRYADYPTIPTTIYCAVRAVNRDGSVSGWVTATSSNESLLATPTWASGNPFTTCTMSLSRVKFTGLAKAYCSWEAVDDTSVLGQYIISWRDITTDDTGDTDTWHHRHIPGNRTKCWIRGLRHDDSYYFKIRAVNKVFDESTEYNYGSPTATAVNTSDTTAPTNQTPIIANLSPYYGCERGVLFIHANQSLAFYTSAITGSNDVAFIHVRYKLTTGGLWRHKIVKTASLDNDIHIKYITSTSSAETHMTVMMLDALIPNTSYTYNYRMTGYNLITSAWSGDASFTTSDLTLPTPTLNQLQSGVVPLFKGFFGRTQYRIVINFTVPATESYDVVKRIEARVKRNNIYVGSHFFDITTAGVAQEEHIPILFSAGIVFEEDVDSEFSVDLRTWALIKSGTATGDTTLKYRTPESTGDITYTPSVELTARVLRIFLVTCISDINTDLPNNISHFTVHARAIRGNEPNWVPDTRVLSKDRVATVPYALATVGIPVHVPYMLAGTLDGEEPSKRWNLVFGRDLDKEFDGVDFKVIGHCWEVGTVADGTNNGKMLLKAKKPSTNVKAFGNTGDVTLDESDNTVHPIGSVAAWAGDMVFAPAIKTFKNGLECPNVNNYTYLVRTDLSDLSYAAFDVGDIVIICRPGQALEDSTKIFGKIYNLGALGVMTIDFSFNSQTPSKATLDTALLDATLFKVGKASGTYRYIWMDSKADCMKVVKSICDATTFTTAPTVEAAFGTSSYCVDMTAALIVGSTIKTSTTAGDGTVNGAGIVMTSSSIKGYKASSGTAVFTLDATNGNITASNFTGSSNYVPNGSDFDVSGSVIMRAGADLSFVSASGNTGMITFGTTSTPYWAMTHTQDATNKALILGKYINLTDDPTYPRIMYYMDGTDQYLQLAASSGASILLTESSTDIIKMATGTYEYILLNDTPEIYLRTSSNDYLHLTTEFTVTVTDDISMHSNDNVIIAGDSVSICYETATAGSYPLIYVTIDGVSLWFSSTKNFGIGTSSCYVEGVPFIVDSDFYIQAHYKSSGGTYTGATTGVGVAKVGGGTRTLNFVDGLYIDYTDS